LLQQDLSILMSGKKTLSYLGHTLLDCCLCLPRISHHRAQSATTQLK
jgi:hypothetical protein